MCKEYPPLWRISLYGVILLNIQWKDLVTCVSIPLAVGSLSALLTQDSMETFGMIDKPSLAPPGWLFPVVWTVLYILMGLASYLVLTSGKSYTAALVLYSVQLVFNFFWSILFFNLGAYLASFIWLVLLWFLILVTMLLFFQISKPAGYLMLPYLIWVTFAGYLNLAIYRLA